MSTNMNSNKEQNNEGIVLSSNQRLARYSSALIKRGLDLASSLEQYETAKPSIQTWKCVNTLTGHSGSISSVAISSDGNTLVSGSWDETIKIWHLATGELIHTLVGHSDVVSSVAISSDEQTLVSGSLDETIKIWHLSTGKLDRTITRASIEFYPFVIRPDEPDEYKFHSIAISPNGQILASATSSCSIMIWNLHTGELLQRIYTESSGCVTFSPNGQSLAQKTGNGSIKIWNPRTGELLHTFTGDSSDAHFPYIIDNSISFNPDGHTFASTTSTVTFDNFDNVDIFDPDGQILIVPNFGHSDYRIKIWNINTGEVLHTLTGHSDWILCVAFSPNGKLLASAGDDETIGIWHLSP